MQPPARHRDRLPTNGLDGALGTLPAPTRNRHRDRYVAIVVITAEKQIAMRGPGSLGHASHGSDGGQALAAINDMGPDDSSCPKESSTAVRPCVRTPGAESSSRSGIASATPVGRRGLLARDSRPRRRCDQKTRPGLAGVGSSRDLYSPDYPATSAPWPSRRSTSLYGPSQHIPHRRCLPRAYRKWLPAARR